MLDSLKQEVCAANLLLPRYGLVTFTWGNVSAIDRPSGLVVIKPSGLSYDVMKPDDMVVVDLNGNMVDGRLRPSSDLATHLELYKAFPGIGGVVHTHSAHATAFAQAGRGIPFYGTTHADDFYGEIPCTRDLVADEVKNDYERNTGLVITETFQTKDYEAIPGVLVKRHGVFTWGPNAEQAVHHAVVLETVAGMALETERLNPQVTPAPGYLADKHYFRKHGEQAYYGQI